MINELKPADIPDEDVSKAVLEPLPDEPEPASSTEATVPTWDGQIVARTRPPRSAKAL